MKLVPVTVTAVPPAGGPVAGEIPVMVGAAGSLAVAVATRLLLYDPDWTSVLTLVPKVNTVLSLLAVVVVDFSVRAEALLAGIA